MKITAQWSYSFTRRLNLPKIVISLFLISIAYLLLSSPVNAQTYSDENVKYNSYSASNTLNTSSNVALNSHNAVQVLFIDFLSAISCQLSGIDPTSPNGKCLGVNPETGEIGFVESGGGAIAVVGSLIDATFTPPASSIQYVAYLRNNFGFAKNTYAQAADCQGADEGIGFCTIKPLLDIWIVMRNIVYLLFIIVFIIVGMGIMLRLHIDPRTVMTMQNQIPKIIVGILAITFSFAIAGLLIDFMWITVHLFASVISQAANATDFDVEKIIRATNPFYAADNIREEGGVFEFSKIIGSAFANVVSDFVVGLGWGILSGVVGAIVNVLAVIIIFIAILIALLRLWISLLLAFINIILDIIFAPWWILAGLLPGGPLGLGAWIRDLVANLAVFPVAIGFLLLGKFLITAFSGGGDEADIAFPLLGGQSYDAIAVLIGFGFILMLPSLLSSIKAALKTPKLNFGPMFGPVGAAVSYPKNVASSVGGIWAGRKEYHMKEDPGSKDGYSWGQKGIGGSIKQRIFR